MSAQRYQDMRDAGAREFLTDGPNSGGVAGLILHEGRVYHFFADWTPHVDEPGTPVAEFVAAHWGRNSRGYTDLIDYVVAEDPTLEPK